MKEMQEMAHILHNLSDLSLIIIDELGRGTATTDGLAISLAICDTLVKTKGIVFLATHCKELAHHLQVYPNVCKIHLRVSMNNQAKQFKYM